MIKFTNLKSSDLIVNEIYAGGTSGTFGDDPISKLLGVGNQGGFRRKGSAESPLIVALYSTLSEEYWPDEFVSVSGQYIYYGDNKSGDNYLDTFLKGNIILKNTFLKEKIGNRKNLPPFFVLTKGTNGRDVIFRGLAVPARKPLEVVTGKYQGNFFQNYKANFDILDVRTISRKWITDLQNGNIHTTNTPVEFANWASGRKYKVLPESKFIEPLKTL